MTRLTNTTYLAQHHQLKSEWLSEGGGAFVMHSPTEQWALHGYYEFTKNLNDGELLAHRAAASRVEPSLPHRAGKAFTRLRLFRQLVIRDILLHKQGVATTPVAVEGLSASAGEWLDSIPLMLHNPAQLCSTISDNHQRSA